MEGVTLVGKTAVVTGANTGIGKETARELARAGARVILACRDVGKAEAAKADIVNTSGSREVVVMQLDLASFTSIRAFAEKYNQHEERLDMLINNAGVLTAKRLETENGNEMMFAVNHLGHFLLTNLLLDKLKQSAPSRVVVVSSAGHEVKSLDFNDLDSRNGWSSLNVYCKSKTANILFATHLAKLLQGSGVTVYSLHPGVIETELGRDHAGSCLVSCFACVWKCCPCTEFLTPEEGAHTSLYCAVEPRIATHTGKYYSDCKEKTAKSYATNPELARRLWTISCNICGLES